MQCVSAARLAQSVEHQTFNLRVMGSSPISGDYIFCFNFEQQETMQHIKCAKVHKFVC